MKYTIKRHGIYSYTETSELQQTVEVEADSETEAINIALDDDEDDGGVSVMKEDGDSWLDWDRCEEREIVGQVLCVEYHRLIQLAAAAENAPVFKENGELV